MTSIYAERLILDSWLDVGQDNVITYAISDDVATWTTTERGWFAAAMAAYEAVANIDFQEVDASVAEIVNYKYTNATLAHEQREDDLSIPGLDWTGWLDTAGDYGTHHTPLEGFYIQDATHTITPWLIAHELGHALGLSHPHGSPYEAHTSTPWPGVTPATPLGTHSLNTNGTSVMSYNALLGARAEGPMVFDIEALQVMYGANTTTNAGNTTHNIISGKWVSIYDVSGIDTFNGTAGDDLINLSIPTLVEGAAAAGYASYRTSGGATGGITIGPGTIIENAAGNDGDDTITGNGYDNTLSGGLGDDTIWAGAGADVIWGGGGADDLNLGNDTSYDLVYARNTDVLHNFDSGEDDIDLTGLGVDKVWTTGSGSSWMLYASTNGVDNTAEIEITLLQSNRPNLASDVLWP